MLAVFSVVSTETIAPEQDETAYVIVYADRAEGEGTASVGYSTSPGSAEANEDYTPVSGRLTFTPQDISLVIPIPVINDSVDEPDETFTLTLSNPSSGSSVDSQWAATTVTIIDDDEPDDQDNPQPEIEVFAHGAEVPDGVGEVDFGSTRVNNPVLHSFSVRNVGNATLNLSNLTVPAGFSVYNPLSLTTLPPDNIASFTIQLDAAFVGTYSGQLTLGNNDNPEDGDAEDPQYNFTIRGVVNPGTSSPVSITTRRE